jgi:hypothetical protein
MITNLLFLLKTLYNKKLLFNSVMIDVELTREDHDLITTTAIEED